MAHQSRRLRLSPPFILALLLCGILLRPTAAYAQWANSPPADELPATSAVEWVELVRERVWQDRINPPAAARIYGYTGVTIYESVVLGAPNFRSLDGQLNDLNNLPYPEVEDTFYDWLAVMDVAVHKVVSGLMPAEASRAAFDGLYTEHLSARTAAAEERGVTLDASLAYGAELGEALLAWAKDDGYDAAHARPYTLPVADWAWVPTTPGTSPVEPHMADVRTFFLRYPGECTVTLNVEYSEDPASDFYKQAMEVKEVGDNLTQWQRETALFWVDTPGISSTPAGHWMSIASQMAQLDNMSVITAGQLYGMMGVVLSDVFNSGWVAKYQYNLLRPVTYINRHINRRWRPFIETPPFPEYPSGHSVGSGAAADMLTFLLGARAFTDRTHEHDDFGIVRSYTTFEAAANEAAMSRLYGGIHYRIAIENGLRQGRCVAQAAIDRIVMNQFTQGGA